MIGYKPKGTYIKNAWCEPKEGMYGEIKIFCYREGGVYSGNSYPGYSGGIYGYPYGRDNSWNGVAKDAVRTVIGIGAQVGVQYLQGHIYKKFYKPRGHTRGRGW